MNKDTVGGTDTKGDPALNAWSVGPLYPWVIVGTTLDFGPTRWFARFGDEQSPLYLTQAGAMAYAEARRGGERASFAIAAGEAADRAAATKSRTRWGSAAGIAMQLKEQRDEAEALAKAWRDGASEIAKAWPAGDPEVLPCDREKFQRSEPSTMTTEQCWQRYGVYAHKWARYWKIGRWLETGRATLNDWRGWQRYILEFVPKDEQAAALAQFHDELNAWMNAYGRN